MKAKAKLTRLWSVLLVLVMVVGLLPTAALAAEPATATADFTTKPTEALELLNAAKTPGAADSTWDAETNTLTLNGVNFTTTNRIAVKLPDGAIIELNGENTITSTFSGSDYCYGITAKGDLTIQGTGTLTVTSGNTTGNGECYGIQTSSNAAGSNVTINGGTVNATGGTATNGQSYGIYAYSNVIINGGTVTATGGTAKECSYGIFAKCAVTINDGTVTATGGTITGGATYHKSSGIHSGADGSGDTTINGGIVKATGGTATSEKSYGIDVKYGQLIVSGGAVIATANGSALSRAPSTLPTSYWWRTANSGGFKESSKSAYSYGANQYVEIWSWDPTKTIDFTAVDTTEALALLNAAKTGRAEDSTWDSTTKTLTLKGVHFVTTAATALKLPDGATIVLADGTTNTIKGGDSGSKDCYGIYGVGGLTIQGGSEEGTGQLTVTAGDATGEDNESYGIRAYGVSISGGEVEATGGAVSGTYHNSYGIYAITSVTISGGEVEATGGTASGPSGYSFGIYMRTNVTISGGTVIAEAGSVGDSGTAAALNRAPTLTITAYSWRTSDSEKYQDPDYTWADDHTYVEIKSNPTITFDANGGKVNGKDTDTAATNAAGKLTDLPEPTRSGYTFKEWNTERNGTGTKVTEETTFTENTTVYAQWEVATVSIPSVAITDIDAPVSNNALDTTAACETTGVSSTAPEVTWTPNHAKAHYGEAYTASVTLTAAAGYAFADGTTATVNDNSANVTKKADGTLTVTYTFPATAKHNIEITVDTDVRGGDAAKNPTISSGYEFALCVFPEDTNGDGDFTRDLTWVIDKDLLKEFAEQHGKTLEDVIAALKGDGLTVKTEFTAGYKYSVYARIQHSDGAEFAYDEDDIATNAIVKINGKDITAVYKVNSNVIYFLPGTDSIVFTAAAPTPDPVIPVVPTYTVAVADSANGSVTASAARAARGSTVTLTVKADEGYALSKLTVTSIDGQELTLSDKGNGTYTFTMTAGKVTVTAVFAAEKCDGGDNCATHGYTDIDTSEWYHTAVDYVITHDMMSGFGGGVFSPDGTFDRSMMAQVLYNLEKKPETAISDFTDLVPGTWYVNAVNWAATNGIAAGYGSTFGPETPITREQVAQFLYNFARFKGYDLTARADLTQFVDGDKTSDWAQTAMQWAVASGILGGKGGKVLDPTATATRAEVAQMLMSFCEKVAR